MLNDHAKTKVAIHRYDQMEYFCLPIAEMDYYGKKICVTAMNIYEFKDGKMHFRLAKLALSPFGMEVV